MRIRIAHNKATPRDVVETLARFMLTEHEERMACHRYNCCSKWMPRSIEMKTRFALARENYVR